MRSSIQIKKNTKLKKKNTKIKNNKKQIDKNNDCLKKSLNGYLLYFKTDYDKRDREMLW